MIKVFQIIPSLNIGGGQKVALDIARNIEKNKFDVTIITFSNENKKNYSEEYKKNVKVVELHKKRGFDVKFLINLVKYIKKQKPDVIHTHLNAGPYMILPSIFAKTKVKVHTIHSMAYREMQGISKFVMKFAYYFLNFHPVAIGEQVKQSIIKEYHLNPNRVYSIYNGVDQTIFKKYDSKKESEFITLINVARFDEIKNHHLLIDAFYEATKTIPNIKLKLLGDGPLKKDIEKLVQMYEIKDKVIFLGNCNDVAKELNESDIFILTSLCEGVPLSVIEAMSCGLPVISTKVGGVSDLVKNNQEGLLVGINVKEVRDAIIKLAKDRKKIIEFGDCAHITSKKFDVQNMVKGYEEIYERSERKD